MGNLSFFIAMPYIRILNAPILTVRNYPIKSISGIFRQEADFIGKWEVVCD